MKINCVDILKKRKGSWIFLNQMGNHLKWLLFWIISSHYNFHHWVKFHHCYHVLNFCTLLPVWMKQVVFFLLILSILGAFSLHSLFVIGTFLFLALSLLTLIFLLVENISIYFPFPCFISAFSFIGPSLFFSPHMRYEWPITQQTSSFTNQLQKIAHLYPLSLL